MIRIVTRIPFAPAAKVLALIHFVFGAIGAAIGFAVFQLQDTPEPYSGLWPIIAPMYAAVGLVITLSAVLLYNLIARFFGGIQVEYDGRATSINTSNRD